MDFGDDGLSKEEDDFMKAMRTKIGELRTQFHLSQDYVAHYLGIDRSAFALLEDGHHSVTSDNAEKLGVLFGVSTDLFLHGTEASRQVNMLTRTSKAMDERDETEIMNLLRIRNQIKAHTNPQT